LRPAFAGLAVYPDDFRSLAKGLRLCYRDTRKAFQHGFASDRDEDLHDWRKCVQHHWRQMQLLAPCFPSELTARAEAARTLSQILGDDHDISLLSRLISTPTMVFGTQEETAAFLKRCRKRHKALRKEASKQGELLFAERSRPFAERLAAGLKHQNGPERSVPIAASIEMLTPARKDRRRIEQAALDQALFR